MSLRMFYLEYHRQDRNTHKFWRGIQKGRFFLGHYGRVGTAGQHRLWTRGSSAEASSDWQAKYDEKREKGYVELPDPLSNDDLLRLLTTVVAEEPYDLYWNTELGHPVLPEHLMQAVSEAEAALVQLGHPHDALVRYIPEGEGHVRIENEADVVCFGYPPPGVIASWTSEDLREPLTDFKSRDGWLGSDGTGSGVITTGRGWIDLPARIFLARLNAAVGLRVIDSFDEGVGIVPSMPDLGLAFEWADYARELDAITQRLGWLPGLVRSFDSLQLEIDGQPLTFISW